MSTAECVIAREAEDRLMVRDASDIGLNDQGRLQLLAQALDFIPHALGTTISWGGVLGEGGRFQPGLPVLVRSRAPYGLDGDGSSFQFSTEGLAADMAVPEDWRRGGVTEICESPEMARTRPFGSCMLEAHVRPVAAICARAADSTAIFICLALTPGQPPLRAAQWQALTMMYPYLDGLWRLEREIADGVGVVLEAQLTPRESEVARLVSGGLSNAEIGNRLGIAEGTVKAHLNHIFEKLGIRSRTELAVLLAARLDKGRANRV